jgi:uncharacterized protein (DUF58 family)
MALTPARSVRQRGEQLAAALPPLLVAADRVASTVAQGVHGRRRVGTGDAFWQFRQYQFGDAASRVDWRRSAKSDRLFVRETEWAAAESVWLWRDGSASMRWKSSYASESKRERAEILLLALAALLIRGGERVALLGVDRLASSGRAVLDRFSATLSGNGSEASLPAVEELPRHARVVLIGDFLSPLAELDKLVRAYAAAGIGGHLMQIVDPAEEDLPYAGRTRFTAVEGSGELLVGRVEALRPDWAARLKRRSEALSTLARNIGWTVARHRTDRPPQSALLSLYTTLAGDTVQRRA